MPVLFEVPLHLALVWIYFRDEEPVRQIYKDGYSRLESVLAACKSGETSTPGDAMNDAWHLLRQKIDPGVIDVRGTPFWKGGEAQRIGEFDDRYDRERDVYPNSHPRKITRQQAEQLVIDYHATELRLRPVNWLSNGGHWWREVETDWEDVLKLFGHGVSEFAQEDPQVLLASEETLVVDAAPGAAEDITAQVSSQALPASENIPAADTGSVRGLLRASEESAFNEMSVLEVEIIRAFKKRRAAGEQRIKHKDWNAPLAEDLSSKSLSMSSIYRAFGIYKKHTGIDLFKAEFRIDLTQPDKF